MESLNKQQLGCYFHTVIEHMIYPLKEQIKNGDMCEEKVTEAIRSVHSLLQFITSFDEVQTLSQSENEFDILVSLIRDICFPLIYSVHHLPLSEKGRAVSLITHLICACCQRVPDETLSQVVTQIFIPFYSCCNVDNSLLLVLKNDTYHNSMVELLDKLSCLELFGCLLNNENFFIRYLTCIEKVGINKDAVLEELFQLVFRCSTDEAAFCKSFTVLSKLLTHFPSFLQCKCATEVWQMFTAPKNTSHGSIHKTFVWQSLYICYSLKSYFFPLDEAEKEKVAAKISSNNFWAVVQSGLASPDPTHRKLAMYLLKRLVDTCSKNSCSVNSVATYNQNSAVTSLESLPLFWWSSGSADKLSVIWEDFILLIETLEEKQV